MGRQRALSPRRALAALRTGQAGDWRRRGGLFDFGPPARQGRLREIPLKDAEQVVHQIVRELVDVPLLASRGSDLRRRGWLADGVGGGDSVNLGAWIARAAMGR